MIKIEKVVLPSPEQWEAIIRGMRNPKNSWERSDSSVCAGEAFGQCGTCEDNHTGRCTNDFVVGNADHKLMNDLSVGGPVHAKYRRMISVYLDITAPLYWWKEFDTYKVGTVANSCSTMHKIHEKEFTLEDFSCEHLVSGWAGKDKNGVNIALPGPADCFDNIVIMLNRVRNSYLVALKTESETGLSAKDIWWQMIQLLPSSYNQKRTVMLNYEVLVGIYKWRKNHKLDEWKEFCKWIESLPYSELITRAENKDVLEHPVSPLLKPDNDLPIDNGMEFRPTRDDVTVCRCKDCEMFISIDKIKDDEEYGDLDTEPCIKLGLDGFCANTGTWACTDGYCSDAIRKEN